MGKGLCPLNGKNVPVDNEMKQLSAWTKCWILLQKKKKLGGVGKASAQMGLGRVRGGVMAFFRDRETGFPCIFDSKRTLSESFWTFFSSTRQSPIEESRWGHMGGGGGVMGTTPPMEGKIRMPQIAHKQTRETFLSAGACHS